MRIDGYIGLAGVGEDVFVGFDGFVAPFVEVMDFHLECWELLKELGKWREV